MRRENLILAEERTSLGSGLLRRAQRDAVTSFAFIAAKKAEHSIALGERARRRAGRRRRAAGGARITRAAAHRS